MSYVELRQCLVREEITGSGIDEADVFDEESLPFRGFNWRLSLVRGNCLEVIVTEGRLLKMTYVEK